MTTSFNDTLNGLYCSLPTDGSQGGPYYVPGTGVLVLSGGVSGTYTCTGTNQFGSDSVEVTIAIVTTQSESVVCRVFVCVYCG